MLTIARLGRTSLPQPEESLNIMRGGAHVLNSLDLVGFLMPAGTNGLCIFAAILQNELERKAAPWNGKILSKR